MRRLVVLCVVRGVVWVGRGGRFHRVRGLVMGFPLVAAGGGPRGGLCRRGLWVVGVVRGLRSVRQWSGPGVGAVGDGLGMALLVAGGGGRGFGAGWESGRPAWSCGCCVCVLFGSAPCWRMEMKR